MKDLSCAQEDAKFTIQGPVICSYICSGGRLTNQAENSSNRFRTI